MEKMIFFVLFFLCTKSLAEPVKFKDCGSEEGKAVDVLVKNCPAQPCIIFKGQNASIDIDFKTNADVQSVTVNLVGVIGTLPIPFPIPHKKACAYPPSQLKCPLKAGKKQHYHLELPVRKEYPTLKLEAKVYILDENEKTIICVEIPLQIEHGAKNGHL